MLTQILPFLFMIYSIKILFQLLPIILNLILAIITRVKILILCTTITIHNFKINYIMTYNKIHKAILMMKINSTLNNNKIPNN